MKLFVRLLLIAVVVMGLSVAAVNAQEEASFPEDLDGFMVQTAQAGTLIAGEEGGYILTLAGVNEVTSWLFDSPFVSAGRADTLTLALDWAAAPDGLVGSAILDIDEATIMLDLTNPRYDVESGDVSYDAEINAIFSYVDLKDDEVPAGFSNVTLFVSLDTDFLVSLDAGYTTRTEGTRAPGGKIDLNDPRVIACSQSYPDGGQDYFQCLEDSGVTSTGGGGGGGNGRGGN